jgi:hypothetical protein
MDGMDSRVIIAKGRLGLTELDGMDTFNDSWDGERGAISRIIALTSTIRSILPTSGDHQREIGEIEPAKHRVNVGKSPDPTSIVGENVTWPRIGGKLISAEKYRGRRREKLSCCQG